MTGSVGQTPCVLQSAFLRFYVRSFDDRPPLFDFGLLPCTKGLRRLLLAREAFLAKIGEPRTHCRVGQGLDNRGIEPSDDGRRRTLGCPKCLPGRHVEPWQSSLVHRRDIGRCRQTCLGHDGIGLDRAGTYMRQGVGCQIDHDVDVSSHQVVDRRAGAAIRDGAEARAGFLLQGEARDMCQAAWSQAIRSLRLFATMAFLATISSWAVAISETGSKSLSTSYGRAKNAPLRTRVTPTPKQSG